MFPNCAYYALATRLEENNEDYEKTVENILSDPLPETPSSPTPRWVPLTKAGNGNPIFNIF
jgi:hypothetical protein